MIDLTHEAIDTDAILQRAGSSRAGAVVLFLGTTRQITDGRVTASLDYECYPEMARRELSALEAEARTRWPLLHCVLVHRLGNVKPGEASVAVAVSSAHRQAAFDAANWLIDTLKKSVPIWKKENWADGSSEWVHPGLLDSKALATGETS